MRGGAWGIPYVTNLASTSNLPAPGAMSARIDVAARLGIFDFDGTLLQSSREVWTVLEPEARVVSEAYWQQWQRCFSSEHNWAPEDVGKMIDLGVVFLRNRFVDTSGRAWIESIERSVAAA